MIVDDQCIDVAAVERGHDRTDLFFTGSDADPDGDAHGLLRRQGDKARIEFGLGQRSIAVDQVSEELAANAALHELDPFTLGKRLGNVIGRVGTDDRADANHRDSRLARDIHDVAHGPDRHQQVAFRRRVRVERSMDQGRAAAELVGKPGRDVIDICIVLALHATGHWRDVHVIGTINGKIVDHRPERLAAGDGDRVAVADGIDQHFACLLADLVKRGLGIAGHRRDDTAVSEVPSHRELALQLEQGLERAVDGDVHHAQFPPPLDQPVHLG